MTDNDTWKAGERVRITSTGDEGYVAMAGDNDILVMQTDEANVHAIWVYLRGTTEFKLVPLSVVERFDVS